MLVLTRKKSETIHIGDDVTIRVIRTGVTTVKIGIVAPNNVRILRGELCSPPSQSDKASGTLEWKPSDTQRMEIVPAYSDQFPHPHIA